MGLVPLEEEALENLLSLCAPTRERPCEHAARRAAMRKPEKELSPEPDHTGTLILNFRPPRLGENKFLLGKTPRLWYFVVAAREDEYNYFTLLHKQLQ